MYVSHLAIDFSVASKDPILTTFCIHVFPMTRQYFTAFPPTTTLLHHAIHKFKNSWNAI